MAMEEKECAQVLGRNQHKEETIGILVINNQREILLHKTPYWQSPYVLSHNPALAKPREVAYHFMATLMIETEIYEAFITPTNRSKSLNNNIDHLIITLTSMHHNDLLKQTTAGVWLPFDFALRDAHERPDAYAEWLHKSLDGVALYLKNLLKQSKLLAVQQQVELS